MVKCNNTFFCRNGSTKVGSRNVSTNICVTCKEEWLEPVVCWTTSRRVARGNLDCLRFVIWGTHLSKNLRGTLLAICHCLRFVIWGTHLSKNLRGTLLAICDLGNSFVQKLKGDTACDLSLLAICDLGNSFVQKLKGDTACDL